MGIDPVTATIGAALIGGAFSAVQGQRQANQAKKADKRAADQADRLYRSEQERNNRQQARDPSLGAIDAENTALVSDGQSSTMLTGPTGIDPNSLLLGKNTLLGGGEG